ncbi:MAG: PP2C family serine/threonine-protein phosphatase [Myxococcota bacterium]|nr:PP2C family serine/threonine-protein phosphatase [Myxococcota bacterium]
MGGRGRSAGKLICACALRTDTGLVRENNEDSALALPESGLFVVADGMGGHAAGEVASQLAVETVATQLSGRRIPKAIRGEAALLGAALVESNLAVYRKSREPGLEGMGTTLTALLFRGRTATIAHAGDTRAYLVHKGTLRQLTRDHTLVSLLIAQGVVREEQSSEHPDRHVLTRAVGSQPTIEPEVVQVRVPRTARLLLSSDGLHDVVPPEELARLASIAELEPAASALIGRANELGGPDNVTAILVQT